MKSKTIPIICAATGLLILILDAKTAISGATEGITLCLMSVIPSLFPFLFLSQLLTASLTGTSMPLLRPISKLLRIPQGSESLLVTGLLGGYPTGAQCLYTAWSDGKIDESTAKRMLGFCNNAGPAFLFGILTGAFTNTAAVWALWLIHILSALAAGYLLPGESNSCILPQKTVSPSPAKSLERTVKTMGLICDWIVLFRVLLAFCNRWFLWIFPTSVHIAINGLLELTNGCTALTYVVPEGLRMILCSGLLALGGICVTLQTVSVMGRLGLGKYVPGKLMQACFSISLAAIYQHFFLAPNQKVAFPLVIAGVLLVLPVFLSIFLQKREKKNSIPARCAV